MQGISIGHMLLIGAVLLLFFGPSRLPQLGSSIGKAVRGFKDGINELEGHVTQIDEAKPEQLKAVHEDQKTKV